MKILSSSLLSILFLFSCDQQLNQVVKTYENGQKWSEGNFKDGKVDGSFTFWYENGKKSSEKHYKNNKRDGKWTSWYDNGQKSSERFYNNDKIEGIENYWYKKGQKFRELTYIDNKLISEKTWNEDGSVKKNKKSN